MDNKQQGAKRVFSKIDRVMCNSEWDEVFSTVETPFLLEGEFDHLPALIQFFAQTSGMKPFKFFNF